MSIKYDTKDAKGETRRQRNEKFGMGDRNVEVSVPVDGAHIWNWFWELDAFRPPVEGIAPLNYSIVADWASGTGNLMTRDEAKAIMAMDKAYRVALSDEIRANTERARMEAERKNGVR